MNLICDRCGKKEEFPYEVGDICYTACGGHFIMNLAIDETDLNGKDQHEFTTQGLIKFECNKIQELLLEKNREYGDSAMHPLGIFSKLDVVEGIRVRIDDKLSRIKCGGSKNIKEDTVLDLIGYLILLRVVQHAAI